MSESIRFSVDEAAAGVRLDEFLAARLARVSRMGIANLLARGACAVNGEAARAGRKLSAGDAVEVWPSDSGANSTTPEPLPLEVVYEDEHLIVVVKPTGMLVHPTRGVKSGTLANALTYHLNRLRIDEMDAVSQSRSGLTDAGVASTLESESLRHGSRYTQHAIQSHQPELSAPQPAVPNPQFIRPGIVHRLDRDTSGLLVVAKTQGALSRLSQHFHRRLVEKRYLAVVQGLVERDEMVIDAPIGRDPEAWPAWRVSEGGKQAETRVRVLERRGRLTLLELEPVTGRTNQLRIHCAHIGHPIAGDRWYGRDGRPRLCLHASRLAFHHPSGRGRVEFVSPLPPDVSAVFDE